MANFYAKAIPQGGGGGAGGVTSLNALFGALTLAEGTGIDITDNGTDTITIASTSAGDVTIGAFGSTPNANGLSLSSQVLSMQPADATNPGGVSITTQTFAGAKTFTGVVGISNGTVSAPGLAFSGDLNNGLYYVGADQWALTAGSNAGLEVRKSTGAFANVGMGGSASTSDLYPLLIQRDQATAINVQLSNPNADPGAGAKYQLASSLGNNGFEMGLFSPATVAPDAYAGGNATLRSTGTTAGIALIADDSGAYHKFYVGGNGSGNLYATISATGLLTTAVTVSGLTASQAVVTNGSKTLASLAYASTNTASALVQRDGSGNFSAGTISAALTGTASGNTTYTPNDHGLVISSATNAMTVLAPDASTAKALISGGASADPAWGTLAIGGGGTGQVTKAAAFDALSPMTTGGDLIYGGASGTGTRLANGSAGQYLKSNGTTTAPSWETFTAPTIQKFTSGTDQTYTTPAGCIGIMVELVGGGGGGGSSGTSGTATGTAGTATTWSGSSLSAGGGGGGLGSSNWIGGAGGTAANGDLNIGGGRGMNGGLGVTGLIAAYGGHGGNGFFGGAGSGGDANVGSQAGTANTGGGGGGGSGQVDSNAGAGGGSGAYVLKYFNPPDATYTYTVGPGGAGASAGTGGQAGNSGGSGVIIVTEFYE